MHQSLDLLGSTSRTYLVNGKNVPNPIGDARWYIPPLRLEIVYHWWVYPLVIKPSHIFLDTRGYPWLVQPNVSPACWISCCSVAGISSCAGIIARRISHCAGIIASSVAGLRIVAIAGGVRLCCLGKVRKKNSADGVEYLGKVGHDDTFSYLHMFTIHFCVPESWTICGKLSNQKDVF